jgi:hypothetical protein
MKGAGHLEITQGRLEKQYLRIINFTLLNLCAVVYGASYIRRKHSGFKWVKSAKKISSLVFSADLHNFQFRCLKELHITILTVAGKSKTRQFPEFLNLIFGGFLSFGPTVVRTM